MHFLNWVLFQNVETAGSILLFQLTICEFWEVYLLYNGGSNLDLWQGFWKVAIRKAGSWELGKQITQQQLAVKNGGRPKIPGRRNTIKELEELISNWCFRHTFIYSVP